MPSHTPNPTASATETHTPDPGLSPTPTLTQGVTRTQTASPTVSPTPTGDATPHTATPTPLFDMSQAISVACGQTVQGTTVGKSSWVSSYDCLPSYLDYGGPEVVHVLRAHVTLNIQARLVSAPTNLDVMILDRIDPDGCVVGGDHTALAEEMPPGWYYIVVDGFMGSAGDYTLEVTCPGAPTLTPTHTLTPTPSKTFTPSPTPGQYSLPLVLKWHPSRPTPTPTSSFQYDVRINCGEETWPFTDSVGQVWEPDREWAPGGYGYRDGATYAIEAKDISKTEDDFLYLSERAGGGYDFDVPPGRYRVELRFAEIFPYARGGTRMFDVLLENQVVIDHLDIYSEVGNYRYRAKDYVFEVRVVDGQLNQTYTHWTALTTGFYGKVSAIRVTYVGP